MREGLTPERVAEIKRGYHVGCVTELLAEIEATLARIKRESGWMMEDAITDLLAEIDRLTTMNANLSKAATMAVDELDERDKEIDRLTAENARFSSALDLAAAELDSAEQDAGLYLSLLRRVIRMSCLTIERCPAGYPDVAEFLREEEKANGGG